MHSTTNQLPFTSYHSDADSCTSADSTLVDIQPQNYYHPHSSTSVHLHPAPYVAPITSQLPAQSVIPSNVYAPHTLPLHCPQPLSLFSHVTALDQSSPARTSDGLREAGLNPPPNTFPTPSELLHNLAARDSVSQKENDRVRKAEKRRRAHQEETARSLGYMPTDPDTISSHDKKRYYLDSLEQYVLYLHHQLRLVGVEPVPLERVSSTRGLSSRSIRTMMVHMQKSAGKLHVQRREGEQKYKALAVAGAHEHQVQADDLIRAPSFSSNSPPYKFP